jgi:hypothetical protein
MENSPHAKSKTTTVKNSGVIHLAVSIDAFPPVLSVRRVGFTKENQKPG